MRWKRRSRIEQGRRSLSCSDPGALAPGLFERKGEGMHINTRKKKYLMVLVTVLILAMAFSMNAFATDAVIGKINSLKTFVVNIITAAGSIVLAWGVFEFASAYQSRDTAQQTDSLKKVIAGIIMVFGSQIINSLGG
jgi:hypothetical protein